MQSRNHCIGKQVLLWEGTRAPQRIVVPKLRDGRWQCSLRPFLFLAYCFYSSKYVGSKEHVACAMGGPNGACEDPHGGQGNMGESGR